MQMTEDGLALIRRFEGFRGSAYRCPAGTWTIGYGHTAQAGEPDVTPGMQMSEAAANVLLRADVDKFAREVRAVLKRDLNDAQFSALVSFAYNVGLGAFRSSSVLKAINRGDDDAVPRRLLLWVKAGGRVLPGLVRRRAAEAELFVGGGTDAGRAETGPPERIDGKPAIRSSTVISAILAALASVMSGAAGVRSGLGTFGVVLTAVGLLAALWIIRERLLKAKEEGI